MTDRSAHANDAAETGRTGWRHGLSFRLFGLTVGIILIVELLVFIPSAAGFRFNWLEQKVQAGRIVALSLEAAPSRIVSQELATEMLGNAEVLGVAEITDIREALIPARGSMDAPMHEIDMRSYFPGRNIFALFGTLFSEQPRVLLLHDEGTKPGSIIEVLVLEEPLKAEIFAFSWRILGLSLLISGSAGALVFVALFYQVVRPVQKFTRAVIDFRDDPSSGDKGLSDSGRRDEIGEAEAALAEMQMAVSDSFRQRERLAQLGEAMAKINHDLRNSLATAQLATETLSRSDDPRVQRAAPRLERSLERAITLAQQTLEYGRAEPPRADLIPLDLRHAAEVAADEALSGQEHAIWTNNVPAGAQAMADSDHLHRIFVNLIRNAAQAMADQNSKCEIHAALAGTGEVEICDTGPGLPERARDNLFKPFAGSTKRDGSGLGLAIARELCRSMGGDIRLARTSEAGTVFCIKLREIANDSIAQRAKNADTIAS